MFETKPATEWILGAPVQKASPRYAHAAHQAEFASRLRALARGCGWVGTERRFWVRPPGEEARYLVPDVAHLSFERLPIIEREAARAAHGARSRGRDRLASDRTSHRLHKIDVYLRSGAGAVVEVDPLAKTVQVHDSNGIVTLSEGAAFTHRVVPDFILSVSELFAELDR